MSIRVAWQKELHSINQIWFKNNVINCFKLTWIFFWEFQQFNALILWDLFFHRSTTSMAGKQVKSLIPSRATFDWKLNRFDHRNLSNEHDLLLFQKRNSRRLAGTPALREVTLPCWALILTATLWLCHFWVYRNLSGTLEFGGAVLWLWLLT